IEDTESNNYSDDELSELTQTSEKCNTKFSEKTKNSSLERYLKCQHNIIVSKLKKYQTQLLFISIDPWPKQQKEERENIAAAINNTLAEFKLTNKILALITDNEYTTYILNLAARHGLEIIDPEIINVHALMSKIKVSTRLCNELRELCIIQKLDYLKPELDIEMR
ncbi:16289_t:CDS:2, partial [Racocetra persica]